MDRLGVVITLDTADAENVCVMPQAVLVGALIAEASALEVRQPFLNGLRYLAYALSELCGRQPLLTLSLGEFV
jgi:hypothetical protein